MMPLHRLRSLAAPLLFFWAATASAQSAPGYTPLFDEGLKSVALRLGASRPTPSNGFDKDAKAGPGLSLQGLYYAWDWVGVGADLGYHTFGKDANALALDAIVRLNFLRESSWSPYLMGGAGHAQSSVTRNGAKESSTGGSFLAAGGIEAFVLRGMSVSFEARFTAFRGGGSGVESLAYLLGAAFWFGYD
ncbi:MAG TPA: hypothetical protein DCM05_02435 [Elusimicrobia bacterium]|nr:hypothetical protein [Elusimicrobiota bacterium]